MIHASRMSKHYVPGDIVCISAVSKNFQARLSDKVYSFDTSETFTVDHAYAMCALGSVVAWHVEGNESYVNGWIVLTDEVDRLQIEIDEGRTEFWVEEQP